MERCLFKSTADLRDAFRSPNGAARENTGPLFWMHGTENGERLREYVGHVDEGGQGILTIESRPHIDWMRDGWWRDVGIVLDECRKRGLKVMIFDDYWWPSQGMGGKYPIPERFQCRDVKATVYPSREAPGRSGNEVARIVANEVGEGVFAPATDGDKTIIFTWFTSNVGYGFPTVNGLDEAAVDWFLATYYQPYFEHFGEQFRDGTITGFFFDEPQFRSMWGDALAKELEARGDDAGELLTALKFKLADPEAQSRAIFRYHDARAEVWGRTMYGRQSEWCRKHGVFSSGHFLETAYGNVAWCLSGGDLLRQMKYVEVPGVDLVCRYYYPADWHETNRKSAFLEPKFASSAAHVYNRHGGLNWCEIFGDYGQDITYPQMKWMCDLFHVQGCNFLIPHSFNPKAPDDRDCPPYFYNGGFEPRFPLFRVWADYSNRCALLLSGGGHVCHVAQCVSAVSFHAGATMRHENLTSALQDAQLDCDWLGCDAVESASIKTDPRTGRPSLRAENGDEHYDILSLPAAEYVPFATLEKALAFAKAGGVVLGYGIRPCHTPTRGKTAADVRAIVDEIFAQPTALFLDGEPDGARLREALAVDYPGENRPLAVRHFDFAGLSDADAPMLRANHCERDGDVFLFIANMDFHRRRDLAVRTEWSAERAELWDPMQGTVEKPVVEDGLVKLALEPSQTVFLVWRRAKCQAPPPPRVDSPRGRTIQSTVEETVTPMVSGGADDWTTATLKWAWRVWHPSDSVAQGGLTFRTRLVSQTGQEATAVFLCDNAATLRVNGRDVAVRKALGATDSTGWRAPTVATILLKEGENSIKVVADDSIPETTGLVAAVRMHDGLLRTDGSWEVSRDGEAPIRVREIELFWQSDAWKRFRSTAGGTASPFVESVATSFAFTLPRLGPGERVYFACDGTEGENSAAVTVNGAFAGGFIGAPFRLDVTHAARPGANTLVAKPFRLLNPRIVLGA